ATRMSRVSARATIIPARRSPRAYRSWSGPESCIRGKNGRSSFHSLRPILLRVDRSSRCEDSMDLVGIHLLVPIEDEIERIILKREAEAVGANHLDPQIRQRWFGNRRVDGPRLRRDRTSTVRVARVGQQLAATRSQL